MNASLKKLLPCAAALAAAGLILAFPSEISSAISEACNDCFGVIIPSLFAFTILAVYFQKSGLYRTALKPLTFPLSKLLRTDEEICALIILSNTGGYPIGAKLLSEAVKSGRLSKKDAGRLLCCCFGSGPAFVIGLAGQRVFGSAAAGAVMYAACVMSSLVMAAIVRSRGEFALIGKAPSPQAGSGCLITSVTDAARVMFTVCAMITGFSVVTKAAEILRITAAAEGLFSLLGSGENSGKILPALLEVSRVKELSPGGAALPLCAGLLSFGGICVIMQVAALAGDIPLKGFLLARIPCAAMSALFSLPALILPQNAVPTASNGAAAKAFSSGGALGFCVFMMSVILLASSGKKNSAPPD